MKRSNQGHFIFNEISEAWDELFKTDKALVILGFVTTF